MLGDLGWKWSQWPEAITLEGAPKKRSLLLDALGPGLITGASDDDPSGIATYSQAGAQFGYSLGWTLLLTYPLMWAIQLISARIRAGSAGNGIAGNIRRYYYRSLLYPLVGMVLVANTINIGADIGAMGAAVKLLVGGPSLLYVAAFGLGHGAARGLHAPIRCAMSPC